MSTEVPEDLQYTAEHEWWRASDGAVGITDFAQRSLGDVVFVELPSVGAELTAGTPFGTVESVKSVSDLYAPVSGRVAAVNRALESAPELVNRDPYGQGWMIKLVVASGAEAQGLLSAADYRASVEGK